MEDQPEGINSDTTPRNRIKWYRSGVEVCVIIYFFTYSLSESVFSNLVLFRICRLTFDYNETICSSVIVLKNNDTSEIEGKLQSYASSIIMTKFLVEGIFPAFISLFLGPWSDKNGRKPLIIFSVFGYFTYFCLIMVFTNFDQIGPWYIVLAVIPNSMLGGLTSLITGSFCYISDISNVANRSFRMAILEGAILVGILFGSICSSYAFQALNYIGVFILCGAITFIGVLYAVFVLNESVLNHTNGRFSALLDVNLIKDMFGTCFKQRSNHNRLCIWFVMLTCSLGIFVLQGDTTVDYLFTRKQLEWDLRSYTIYNAVAMVMTIIGTLITAFLLQKMFKLNDGIISMISYLSCIVRSMMVAFATKSWHMYLSSSISMLRAVSGPVNRSILTKLVQPEEAGKVLSLTSSFENIIPLLSSFLYGLFYKSTLDTFPGAFNLISAFIYTLCLTLIGIVEYLLSRTPSNYEALE